MNHFLLVGLLTLIFIKSCVVCCPMSGFIWNSTAEEFVALSSINRFLQIHNMNGKACLSQDGDLEKYNFNGRGIRVSGYEEKNILMFYDDDTKLTGVYGDVWTLLSEYLNFEMILIRLEKPVYTLIHTTSNETSVDFTYMQGNNTDILLPMHVYNTVNRMDFTEPIYRNYYRLYIQREFKIDKTWLFKLFNWQVWLIILIIFIIFASVSYFSEKLSTRISKTRKENFPPKDHVFYNFARICNQGYVPLDFESSRILGISMSMFSSLILIAYSSQLISHMTQKSYTPPFSNLQTLYADTKYNVISFKNTVVDIMFQVHRKRLYQSLLDENRISFINYNDTEIKLACSDSTNIAIFKANNVVLTKNCKLEPVGRKYYETWIAAGLPKGYKYRRIFNRGIKKLRESGFLNVLSFRWGKSQIVHYNNFEFISVTMQHVEMIFSILVCGMIMSLIILVIENIMFFAKYW